ncbi:hypothetical protein VDG1235_1850 [Verrucomicrobiia bacterium DG1235]|nr:hypothetical protein VDG1235_1850 [Verrucomicrobiae bacterium DG1235]
MYGVYLRRPEESDGREFVEAAKGSVSMHRPWVYPTVTVKGFAEYLDRIQDSRHEGYLVCRKSDDRMAGIVNLSEITHGALQCAFVGYWGVQGYCGGGRMTRGLALVFDEAFIGLGLHRLEVNIQPGNERSVRLVERLGLSKEGFSPRYLKIGGEWRDHERWALTSEDWSGAESVLARLSASHSSPSK